MIKRDKKQKDSENKNRTIRKHFKTISKPEVVFEIIEKLKSSKILKSKLFLKEYEEMFLTRGKIFVKFLIVLKKNKKKKKKKKYYFIQRDGKIE